MCHPFYGTLLRRYAHGQGVDEPLVWYEGVGTTDRRWLLSDNRGSVIAESDSGGNVSAKYEYGPYGEPNTWTGSRFRYTGQIALNDDVNVHLYHYKARVYDPVLARFLQTDPIGYRDDLNLYAYVGNDPIDKSDPTGQCDPTRTSCIPRRLKEMTPVPERSLLPAKADPGKSAAGLSQAADAASRGADIANVGSTSAIAAKGGAKAAEAIEGADKALGKLSTRLGAASEFAGGVADVQSGHKLADVVVDRGSHFGAMVAGAEAGAALGTAEGGPLLAAMGGVAGALAPDAAQDIGEAYKEQGATPEGQQVIQNAISQMKAGVP